ncbi:MAG: 2-hydroxyacyl-CoA dehydratase [Candidatus Omnitrophica bacterium]|nr:2-hydroxyacyl-CoA dehydratase [Candidatus Omnitrophota bacterium]
MIESLSQITFEKLDESYDLATSKGYAKPWYSSSLCSHIENGDERLLNLKFDNSNEAHDLWNFLLSENERLDKAREDGKIIVGAMKDLGTIPVIAYSFPNICAFYPDGAWWIPCVMELKEGLLEIADKYGIDESFCPVRAMIGAFDNEEHFPLPDVLVCSVGATCDDFSSIAQRIEGMGQSVFWWEMLHRRDPMPDEKTVALPGGVIAPEVQVEFIKKELLRIIDLFSSLMGEELTDSMLKAGIDKANEIRTQLNDLRNLTFISEVCPLPALELLVAEMMALHYCSDRDEVKNVLNGLLKVVRERVNRGVGFFGKEAVKIFWVNPVADLRVMNILEECGGRICGTENLFTHALDLIPTDVNPLDALARTALADPMACSANDRAKRICRDIKLYNSEAVIISRIPGASHCALEGSIIKDMISLELNIPVIEIEVSPISDSFHQQIKTRITTLVETVKGNR